MAVFVIPSISIRSEPIGIRLQFLKRIRAAIAEFLNRFIANCVVEAISVPHCPPPSLSTALAGLPKCLLEISTRLTRKPSLLPVSHTVGCRLSLWYSRCIAPRSMTQDPTTNRLSAGAFMYLFLRYSDILGLDEPHYLDTFFVIWKRVSFE